MKKLFAMLLALTLLCSLGVAAFADDTQRFENQAGTLGQSIEHHQLITTTVQPASWTLIIPADYTIPYLETEALMPGKVEITDVENLSPSNEVLAFLEYSGYLLSDSGTERIPYTIFKNKQTDPPSSPPEREDISKRPTDPESTYDLEAVAQSGEYWSTLGVRIDNESWNVNPGTYSERITFTSYTLY